MAQDQDDVQVQETAYQADDVSENELLETMQGEGDEDATIPGCPSKVVGKVQKPWILAH